MLQCRLVAPRHKFSQLQRSGRLPPLEIPLEPLPAFVTRPRDEPPTHPAR